MKTFNLPESKELPGVVMVDGVPTSTEAMARYYASIRRAKAKFYDKNAEELAAKAKARYAEKIKTDPEYMERRRAQCLASYYRKKEAVENGTYIPLRAPRRKAKE